MASLSQIPKLFRKLPGRSLAPALAIGAVFLAGWYFGLPADKPSEGGAVTKTTWTCSMHPSVRQPNFGLCPICAMDLIPLEAGIEGGGLRELTVSPEAAALLDLRVTPIVRAAAAAHIELFGRIAYDERKVTTTTARVAGRLDRFYVDYTGTRVRKGDHIAEIYSPDLFVAQQDLIKAARGVERARRSGSSAAADTQRRLLKSARERLRLLQLTEEQIVAIAAQKTPSEHITLFARNDGLVTKRHVLEGAYVKEGQPLFSVAGLDSVWLNMEAYERDLAWLRFAQRVTFTVEALPGRTFDGRIAYIDPEIDPMKRVVKLRVNVANPGLLLKPGMFARATVNAQVAADGRVIDETLAGKWISPMHPEIIRDAPGECPICGMPLLPAEELGFIHASVDQRAQNPLQVPLSAVLRTGRRTLVYVRTSTNPAPVFEGREIVLGPRAGTRFIVESGLSEGEMVVTHGAFKLDSELQLKAKPSMMNRNVGLVETPAAEAEASLLGQWGPVPRALGRLRIAQADGDHASAKIAITTMATAVKAIQTNSFQDKTLPNWKEFSQRLLNALAEARARPPTELTIAYRDLRAAVQETGRYLGLPYAPVAPGETADAATLATLRTATDRYQTLASALATDDLATAKTARTPLAEALQPLGIDPAALLAASDLATLRIAFQPISDALIMQVKKNGMDHVGNAYVVHCPMSLDDGADWISTTPSFRNPYRPDMSTCGTVTANISFDPETPPSSETPSHDH